MKKANNAILKIIAAPVIVASLGLMAFSAYIYMNWLEKAGSFPTEAERAQQNKKKTEYVATTYDDSQVAEGQPVVQEPVSSADGSADPEQISVSSDQQMTDGPSAEMDEYIKTVFPESEGWEVSFFKRSNYIPRGWFEYGGPYKFGKRVSQMDKETLDYWLTKEDTVTYHIFNYGMDRVGPANGVVYVNPDGVILFQGKYNGIEYNGESIF